MGSRNASWTGPALSAHLDEQQQQLYREVRAPRIYEGASEIQREIIARALFRAAAETG